MLCFREIKIYFLIFNYYLCPRELISRTRKELSESMVLENECYLKTAGRLLSGEWLKAEKS